MSSRLSHSWDKPDKNLKSIKNENNSTMQTLRPQSKICHLWIVWELMIKYIWSYFSSLACFLWLYKHNQKILKSLWGNVFRSFSSVSFIHSESELYIGHFMSSSRRRGSASSDQLQNMNRNYWIIKVNISQTALTLKLIYAKLFYNFLWIKNSRQNLIFLIAN